MATETGADFMAATRSARPSEARRETPSLTVPDGPVEWCKVAT